MAGDIIQAISVVFVAIIGLIAEKDRRTRKKEREEYNSYIEKQQEEAKEREALAEQRLKLFMQMENAGLKLAIVTAKKLMNQKTNGDVEEAFNAAQEAKAAYGDFINEVVNQHISDL